MDREPFVQCDNLVKIYKVADSRPERPGLGPEVVALQGLDLTVAAGEMLALVGPSGVGKSTLLNVIGGLDTPSAGSLSVAGRDLRRMTGRERVRYMREVVGFVWQQPSRNLLPYLSARENVELPMEHSGLRPGERRMRALELLEVVGLGSRAGSRPGQLSGGEQQRAALAVALANRPPLLLGDELTGQVDSRSAMGVFDAVQAVSRAYGTTVIVVTHDPLVAGRMDRVVAIRDGRATSEIRRETRANGNASEQEWIILDPVGRLQLPRDHVRALDMRELVRVDLEGDHMSIRPGVGAGGQAPAAGSQAPAAWAWPIAGGPRAGVTVSLDKVSRTFEMAGQQIHALRDLTMSVPAGSLAVITGPSGSGKTTLLHLVAGIDEPTAGAVSVGDGVLGELSPRDRTGLLQGQIGFVLQTFGLLPFLTVEENVEVPLRLLNTPRRECRVRVAEALAAVGLADRARHRIYELSGGEQQRVAIARALVKRPALILADEPTGQLDSLTGARIIALLRRIATEAGITVVVASHDRRVREAGDLVFELRDGRLVGAADQRCDGHVK